ncbi:hypothetical protein UQW22_08285 [Isoptericola halotolerans]|uniref:hypothetical protein n=1 Tax=Isoptericola halotolerans TaxID=300560 RepID=UPI00388DC0D7
MTREQVAARTRTKEWERVARAVLDTGPTGVKRADQGLEIEHRRRRAALLGLLAHPGSVATGLCALVLHGVQGAPAQLTPEVAMPTGAPRARRPPVRLRRSPVDRWVDVGGFRCVDRALVEAVPQVGRRHAAALMDSALHRRLIDAERLDTTSRAAAGRRGMARTREWWPLADGRSESPAETWARLSCVEGGFPPDILQLQVAGPGEQVFARVDLAWRLPDGTALLVEIDGQEVHSAPRALYRDRARQNRLATSRTVVRRFTGTDAWHGRVGPEVATVLRGSGWRPHPLPPDAILHLA